MNRTLCKFPIGWTTIPPFNDIWPFNPSPRPKGGNPPPYSQVPHLGYDPFSQSFSHLTIEREPVGTAQVHSDLNKLSAEAAAEHSSSFSEDCEVSDIVCAHYLKKGRQTELRRCTVCKSFSYCNKVCQISDWPSHKQLCKSIQSLNPQN